DWIAITDPGGANGSGDGTVRFTFSPNPLLDPRVGTIAIAGKSFTVIQPAPVISDTTSPMVTVSGYSLSSRPGVTGRFLTVVGGAQDDVGVKQVSWRTDRGANGFARFIPVGGGSASGSWDLDLLAPRGVTNLTISAEDFNGNIGSATTTISYNPEYLITTAGGQFNQGFAGDGGPLRNALFTGPNALAFDKSGNLYIADAFNNRIRKVAADSQIITTIVGTGEANYTGDGGPASAAKISNPGGIAFDAAGNLYFSDTFNHRIRRVDAQTGVITTIAGSGPILPFGNGGRVSADDGPGPSPTPEKTHS